MAHIEQHGNGGMTFVGEQAVAVYRATVIEHALRLYARTGLRLYARTGMRVNRAYTPSAMMQAASQLTGMEFKACDYVGAAEAIKAWRAEAVANTEFVVKEI